MTNILYILIICKFLEYN